MFQKAIPILISLILVTTAVFASEELLSIFPDQECTGGTATVTINEQQVTLACPLVGGPRCKATEECICTAVKNTAGGYDPINACRDKPAK